MTKAYMIRISGRHSRDLTPRSTDDFLGFERAVAALLNREELVVQARQTRPTGYEYPLDGEENDH
jgi:hypothetical protein